MQLSSVLKKSGKYNQLTCSNMCVLALFRVLLQFYIVQRAQKVRLSFRSPSVTMVLNSEHKSITEVLLLHLCMHVLSTSTQN